MISWIESSANSINSRNGPRGAHREHPGISVSKLAEKLLHIQRCGDIPRFEGLRHGPLGKYFHGSKLRRDREMLRHLILAQLGYLNERRLLFASLRRAVNSLDLALGYAEHFRAIATFDRTGSADDLPNQTGLLGASLAGAGQNAGIEFTSACLLDRFDRKHVPDLAGHHHVRCNRPDIGTIENELFDVGVGVGVVCIHWFTFLPPKGILS